MVQKKKIIILLQSVFFLIIFILIFRSHTERVKAFQVFNKFVENKDFTRVEFDVHIYTRSSLENIGMSPKSIEDLWSIIKNAKPGSVPRKIYDMRLNFYFTQADGTTLAVRLKKDFNSNRVGMVFYLPKKKRGYHLISEDHEGKIDKLVRQVDK